MTKRKSDKSVFNRFDQFSSTVESYLNAKLWLYTVLLFVFETSVCNLLGNVKYQTEFWYNVNALIDSHDASRGIGQFL